MHMTPNMSVKLRFQSDSLVNPVAGKMLAQVSPNASRQLELDMDRQRMI